MKIYLFAFYLIFLTACQSTRKDAIDAHQKKILQTSIESSCFNSSHPDFLANVFASNAPSFLWEGVWNQNYSQVKTQILDSTGQIIEFNPLSEIVSKFGAYGLRQIMCGQMAFLTSLNIDGHKIVVKNSIHIIQKNDHETTFQTISEFYYGLFGIHKNKNILSWQGTVKNGVIIPKYIHFGTKEQFLKLDFIDYN